MLTFLAIHLTRIARAFWKEMRVLPVPGPRMIDEIECMGSVLLAIVFLACDRCGECRLGRILRLHGDALACSREFHTRHVADRWHGRRRRGSH
jgi:hypothetical protein